MPTLQSNWTGANFCAWDDVTCTSGGVSVWLDGNVFEATTARLPEWTSDVDGSQVMAVNITLIDFTSLAGTLPASWSRLKHLEALYMTKSALAGTLPEAWADMAQLRPLMLSRSAIHGTLPATWSASANLQYLQLESNKLAGAIPSSWGAWMAIRQVYLGDKAVKVPIPKAWGTSVPLAITPNAASVQQTSESNAAHAKIVAGVNLVAPLSSLPRCSVLDCAVCLAASPFYCKSCDAGYVLSTASWCHRDPSVPTTPRPPTSTTTTTTTTTSTTSAPSGSDSTSGHNEASTSTTTSTTPTPPSSASLPPLPRCSVRHCMECVVSSPFYCKVCAKGYSLTVVSFCRKGSQ